MKKISARLILLCSLLALVACSKSLGGSSNSSEAPTAKPKPPNIGQTCQELRRTGKFEVGYFQARLNFKGIKIHYFAYPQVKILSDGSCSDRYLIRFFAESKIYRGKPFSGSGVSVFNRRKASVDIEEKTFKSYSELYSTEMRLGSMKVYLSRIFGHLKNGEAQSLNWEPIKLVFSCDLEDVFGTPDRDCHNLSSNHSKLKATAHLKIDEIDGWIQEIVDNEGVN